MIYQVPVLRILPYQQEDERKQISTNYARTRMIHDNTEILTATCKYMFRILYE